MMDTRDELVEEEFIVEGLLDVRRLANGEKEYLAAWAPTDREWEPTWVSETAIVSRELVYEFEQRRNPRPKIEKILETRKLPNGGQEYFVSWTPSWVTEDLITPALQQQLAIDRDRQQKRMLASNSNNSYYVLGNPIKTQPNTTMIPTVQTASTLPIQPPSALHIQPSSVLPIQHSSVLPIQPSSGLPVQPSSTGSLGPQTHTLVPVMAKTVRTLDNVYAPKRIMVTSSGAVQSRVSAQLHNSQFQHNIVLANDTDRYVPPQLIAASQSTNDKRLIPVPVGQSLQTVSESKAPAMEDTEKAYEDFQRTLNGIGTALSENANSRFIKSQDESMSTSQTASDGSVSDEDSRPYGDGNMGDIPDQQHTRVSGEGVANDKSLELGHIAETFSTRDILVPTVAGPVTGPVGSTHGQSGPRSTSVKSTDVSSTHDDEERARRDRSSDRSDAPAERSVPKSPNRDVKEKVDDDVIKQFLYSRVKNSDVPKLEEADLVYKVFKRYPDYESQIDSSIRDLLMSLQKEGKLTIELMAQGKIVISIKKRHASLSSRESPDRKRRRISRSGSSTRSRRSSKKSRSGMQSRSGTKSRSETKSRSRSRSPRKRMSDATPSRHSRDFLTQVYVTNLPPKCNANDVKKIFARHNDDIERVFLLNKGNKGKGTACTAFIHFRTKDIALNAIAKFNKTIVAGRELIVKFANSQETKSPRRIAPVPRRPPPEPRRPPPELRRPPPVPKSTRQQPVLGPLDTACRYWAKGFCRNKDNCRFRHDTRNVRNVRDVRDVRDGRYERSDRTVRRSR